MPIVSRRGPIPCTIQSSASRMQRASKTDGFNVTRVTGLSCCRCANNPAEPPGTGGPCLAPSGCLTALLGAAAPSKARPVASSKPLADIVRADHRAQLQGIAGSPDRTAPGAGGLAMAPGVPYTSNSIARLFCCILITSWDRSILCPCTQLCIELRLS